MCNETFQPCHWYISSIKCNEQSQIIFFFQENYILFSSSLCMRRNSFNVTHTNVLAGKMTNEIFFMRIGTHHRIQCINFEPKNSIWLRRRKKNAKHFPVLNGFLKTAIHILHMWEKNIFNWIAADLTVFICFHMEYYTRISRDGAL